MVKVKTLEAIGMALAIIGLIIGLFGAMAYAQPSKVSEVSYLKVGFREGNFYDTGVFNGSSMYHTGTQLSYYPEAITREINGTYTYRTTEKKGGEYLIRLVREYYVQSGKKKIVLLNVSNIIAKGTFISNFSVPLKFNLRQLRNELHSVMKGTGVYRVSQKVYYLISIREGYGDFNQRIELQKDPSGFYYLSGKSKNQTLTQALRKEYDTKTIELPTDQARIVYPILSGLLLFPYMGMLSIKRREDKMRELRDYIVEGYPGDDLKKIELHSKEDLEKVFELLDRPIIHHREFGCDIYSIIDGNRVYQYRVEPKITNNFKNKTK